MPIKSSQGALREVLSGSTLERTYFIDTIGSSTGGGFFDTTKFEYYWSGISASQGLSLKNNVLPAFDVVENTVAETSNNLYVHGKSKITTNNSVGVADINMSAVTSTTGNLQVDSSNNYVYTGTNTSTNKGIWNKGLLTGGSTSNYGVDKPGGGLPTPYTYRTTCTDGVSDGSDTYIAGTYEPTVGTAERGGYILKVNQFNSLTWAKKSGFDVSHIKLIDNGANLLVAGNTTVGTGDCYLIKIDTATGATRHWIAVISNLVGTNQFADLQCIDVDSTGNIVVGGKYNDAGTGGNSSGFVVGLDSGGNERYKKRYVGTMTGSQTTMSIANVSGSSSMNILTIVGENYNGSSYQSSFLSVPYDGTSPGTGSYTVGTATYTYQDTSDVSVLTGGSSSLTNDTVFLYTGFSINNSSLTVNSTTNFVFASKLI